MKTLVFIGVFFALLLALVFVFQYSNKSAEQFVDYSQVTRPEYLDMGKNRYNKFADQLDVFRPGVTRSMKPDQIKAFNTNTNEAIKTAELKAKPEMDGLTNTESVLFNSDNALPLENNVLKAASKCEAVKTRDACSILGNPEFKTCGVCIKGGTDSTATISGTFIGGMLVLDRDRRAAEAAARGTGQEPVYEASTGECPAGYLFVDKAKCQKAVNRLNCKEAGETGGFNGGRTIEGKEVVQGSCAYCPQSGEENTFIYEPKTRSFPIAVRIITPEGTGKNTVKIEGLNPDTNTQTVLATGSAEGGKEIYLNLSGVVKEGQDIRFQIIQEAPHRPRGKKEVFHVGGYQYTYDEAENVCKKLGTEMATFEQVQDSFTAGAQNCSLGYVKDPNKLRIVYPMQVGELRKDLAGPNTDTSGWCGRGVGVRDVTAGWPNEKGEKQLKFAAWCYGVKPPVTWSGDLLIRDFFESVKNASIPSQETLSNIKSQYGIDYVAPYYRGVIIQWEMRTEKSPVPRRASVEPSIVSVMGQSPNTTTVDGFKMFKILRRRGMFSTATRNPNAQIMAPNSNTNKNILANQYWIWSNQTDNSEFYFTAKVPGVFRDPFYPEDAPICPRGPLVGEKSTLDLLKVSPCMKDGQGAGKYSLDCLKFLFQGAGGDLYAGRLSPLNGDLDKLMFDENKKALKEDEILDRLTNLYTIATKGRDIQGALISQNDKKKRRKIINDAGLDMFGKEIVTPCEEVTETADGTIVLVPKSAPFDSECLDYLYLNAGTDKSRGLEGPRNTTVKATYTSIGDRFSGLLNSEKVSEEERDIYPFQTCQRGGTAAPIDTRGNINMTAVQQANAFALANGGTLLAAQDYFNSIFETANKKVDENDPQLMKTQEEYIQKCFGISKVKDPKKPTGCGIMARYVRILRPLSGYAADSKRSPQGSSRSFGSRISLAQIQVFNEMMEEVAKEKPVSAGTNSGLARNVTDGQATVRDNFIYIDDDSANDSAQYLLVDLQDVTEVRMIQLFNRYSDNRLMTNAIVQLLDGDKKVVAHKVTPEFLDTKLAFSKADLVSPVLPGDLTPGTFMYLQNGVTYDMVLGVGPFNGGYSFYDTSYMPLNNSVSKKNASLQIQPSLAGIAGAITIALASNDSYVLFPWSAEQDQPVKGSRRVGFVSKGNWIKSAKEQRMATWIVRPAVSKEPGWFSLQNAYFPTLFLTPWAQGTVWGWCLAAPVNSQDLTHQMFAVWKALPVNQAV